MKTRQKHRLQQIILIGFIATDIAYLWYRLISDEMLIILYSTGLWVPWQPVLIVALLKTFIFGMLLYHSGLQLALFMLLIDASIGTLFALFDVLQYVTLNCECSLMSESAWVKLGIRGSVTAVLTYAWFSKKS